MKDLEMWKKIEEFLEKINLKEIKNEKFYLYGWEPGYEKVLSQNLGYLPFYDDKEMEIKKSLLPEGSPLKAGRMRDETKYITVHNTGMAHPTATAKGLDEYIHSTTRVASWHFSIDDKETYQQLDIDEVGWHAGDGSRKWGETYLSKGYNKECITGGNENSVGIESCVYAGVDFNQVMRRLAKLVAMLLVKYDLKIEDVKQHNDFSGKDCPQTIRHAKRWNELIYLINLELFAINNLKNVSFTWKSLSPDVMDDLGRIIKHPNKKEVVNYQVEVNCEGVSKVYKYSSVLLPIDEDIKDFE